MNMATSFSYSFTLTHQLLHASPPENEAHEHHFALTVTLHGPVRSVQPGNARGPFLLTADAPVVQDDTYHPSVGMVVDHATVNDGILTAIRQQHTAWEGTQAGALYLTHERILSDLWMAISTRTIPALAESGDFAGSLREMTLAFEGRMLTMHPEDLYG